MHRNRDVFCIESDEGLLSPSRGTFTPTGASHVKSPLHSIPVTPAASEDPPQQWDWDIEHEDRKREAEADRVFKEYGPFLVDRAVLRSVVREKMGVEVVRITFLSSGTFHKAYLILLNDKRHVVARVARRFMPRSKTESEVATMEYIRRYTNIPVPVVYHWDSNPYNRLGGEYILMSKADGIPLAQVYHSLPHQQLVDLLKNLAKMIIPLFAHRFPFLGSLYAIPEGSATLQNARLQEASSPQPSSSLPSQRNGSSESVLTPRIGSLTSISTPKALSLAEPASISSSSAAPRPCKDAHHHAQPTSSAPDFYIGPIISWPFFGSNRGDLIHPTQIDRGPYRTTYAYLSACSKREIQSIILENQGKSAPHRLHLDPDTIRSSYHHHLSGVPGDESSDDSDEYGSDVDESDDEWEGYRSVGDRMYTDYRRMQRGTFLVRHLEQREKQVRREMERWERLMRRLMSATAPVPSGDEDQEEFGLDCHDLSLENIFVDERDHAAITCIIDWESTTTRPLWGCAHLPAFLQSSPFAANLFRTAVKELAQPSPGATKTLRSENSRISDSIHTQSMTPRTATALSVISPALCSEWLYHESSGMRLRMAHRFVEWDGWEEGLSDTMLGSEEQENEWFAPTSQEDLPPQVQPPVLRLLGKKQALPASSAANGLVRGASEAEADAEASRIGLGLCPSLTRAQSSATTTTLNNLHHQTTSTHEVVVMPLKIVAAQLGGPSTLPFAKEKEKEQMLNSTGDICGGRGGELGRRLEAWLSVSGGNVNGEQVEERVEQVQASS